MKLEIKSLRLNYAAGRLKPNALHGRGFSFRLFTQSFLGVYAQIAAFGQVLLKQAAGVFIDATLAGNINMQSANKPLSRGLLSISITLGATKKPTLSPVHAHFAQHTCGFSIFHMLGDGLDPFFAREVSHALNN